jgi:hypothetical protein
MHNKNRRKTSISIQVDHKIKSRDDKNNIKTLQLVLNCFLRITQFCKQFCLFYLKLNEKLKVLIQPEHKLTLYKKYVLADDNDNVHSKIHEKIHCLTYFSAS